MSTISTNSFEENSSTGPATLSNLLRSGGVCDGDSRAGAKMADRWMGSLLPVLWARFRDAQIGSDRSIKLDALLSLGYL